MRKGGKEIVSRPQGRRGEKKRRGGKGEEIGGTGERLLTTSGRDLNVDAAFGKSEWGKARKVDNWVEERSLERNPWGGSLETAQRLLRKVFQENECRGTQKTVRKSSKLRGSGVLKRRNLKPP